MSDLLIRGLPARARLQLQRLAKARNLSLNQITLEILVEALKKWETHEERWKRHVEAIDQIRAFRKKHYKEYGLQEDSVKIIRKMRGEIGK